ncbi:hypothetical protein [Pseudoalteromonas denitrificans]|uniref:Uncharacterized protein n=1 Tax=Pseudoalteromonas denitrificans DSM 6059 TaxID=1123010 RepID=A0A1I1KD52_9GAMM|nr:hypothetical protein [Pseudoalteromonas denitrificans]SFC58202.1 hypothetical protein SAMN02745724_02023 [Pseudoalteromonas denitrificans DSM 6059]
MKFKLNKKKIKNLSQDKKSLPEAMTPMVGGGASSPELCCTFDIQK